MKGSDQMAVEKLSVSTDVSNARTLHDNLSESDKMLINAMASTMFVLMQNIQRLQSGYNNGTTLTQTAPPTHN